MITRQKALPVAALLLFALALRVIYLVLYASIPEWFVLTVDNYYHHHWAQVIASGDIIGGTTYFRAPLYAWVLGVLYAIAGDSLWVGRILGLLIGVASVGMTYAIGKRLGGQTVGIIAGLLHALFPMNLYFEQELLVDPLFTLLLEISLYYLIAWWQDGRLAQLGMAGLMLGLSAVTRPTSLIFIPVIVVAILTRKRPMRIREAFVFFIACIIIILPVTIRNLAVAGDPVLISSQGGINLYIGNNPEADGLSAVLPEPYGHNWRLADVVHIAEDEAGHPLKPGQVSSYWTGRAVTWMLENPGDFLRLYVDKLLWQVSNQMVSNNRDLGIFFSRLSLLDLNPLTFGLILIPAVLAGVLFWRSKPELRLILLLVIGYILVSSLFFFTSRFQLPLLPYYFILAAMGITAVLDAKTFSLQRLIIPALAALTAGLLSFLPLVSRPTAAPVQAALARGNYYFAHQDYSTARRFYDLALAADPNFPEVNLSLGAIYFKMGNADSARYYFKREIREHPLRSKGYSNMASLYLVSDQVDTAFALANEAVRLRPYDLLARTLQIRTAGRLRSVPDDSLLMIVTASVAATDSNVYLLNDAAAILIARSLPAAAESILRTAVESRPPPVEMDDEAWEPEYNNSPWRWRRAKAQSYYQLGYLAGVSGRVGVALNYTEEAIARDSSLVQAWLNLINGYRSVGQTQKSDSVLQLAIDRFGEATLRQYLPPPNQR